MDLAVEEGKGRNLPVRNLLQKELTEQETDKNEAQEIYLNFRGWAREDDKIYFANMEFNGLFEMSLRSFEVKHIHTFLAVPLNRFFCVGQYIMKYHDRLVFLMNEERQNKLCCFDLKTREETEIDFPYISEPIMRDCSTFVHGNKGWIIPDHLSFGIYVIDLDTLHIEKDETLSELLKEYSVNKRLKGLDNKRFYFDDKVKNEIIIVNVDTRSKVSFKLPVQNVGGCIINEKVVWIIQTNTTDVYEWNIEENTLNKYFLKDTTLWDQKSNPYMDLIYIKEQDCVFLAGDLIAGIFKTNRVAQTIERAFEFPEDFRFLNNKLRNYSYFAEVERIEDEIWFYPICGNRILVYDIRENTVKGIKCTISLQNIPQFKETILSELLEGCGEHEGIYSLQNMLQLI